MSETFTWGVKNLGPAMDACNAAEGMDSPQVIVNTGVLRELIETAEKLWRKEHAVAPAPRPFERHLADLDRSRQISELQGQVAGLRRDNLMAASELRQFVVENNTMRGRLDVLQLKDKLWTQTTEWGAPGVAWSVAFSGLIIPFETEGLARRAAYANGNAVVLISDYSAPREAPAVDDDE